MWYLWLLLGVLVGCIVTNVICLIKAGFGTFKIDRSNPEKDVCRLELKDYEGIHKKKFLFLRVDNKADLSCK